MGGPRARPSGAGPLDRRPTGGPVDGTATRARPPRGTPDPNRSAAPVPQFAERVGDVVGRADELRRPLPAAGEGRALAAEVGQGGAGEVRLAHGGIGRAGGAVAHPEPLPGRIKVEDLQRVVPSPACSRLRSAARTAGS